MKMRPNLKLHIITYTVPHNNVGSLNRAKVLSFPKDKLRY